MTLGSKLLSILWRYAGTPTGAVWIWLGLATLAAVAGINETAIHTSAGKLAALALVALALSGWVVWRGRWPALSAVGLPAAGAAYLLLVWAELGRPAGRILGAMAALLWQLLRGGDAVPPLLRLYNNLALGRQAVVALIARYANWIDAFGEHTLTDPLVVQLLWGMGIWLAVWLAVWAVWKRHQPVPGILPPGILLATGVYFTGRGYGLLALFLASVLLLQAGFGGWQRQARWRREGVDFAEGLFADLNLVAIPLAVAITVLAYLMPTVSLDRLTRTLYDALGLNPAQVNNVAQSFGLAPAPNPAVEAGLQGLPRHHLLGNPPDLSRQLVMTVQTGEYAPMTPDMAAFVGVPRYYWFSMAFDRYNAWGWVFTARPPEEIAAGQRLSAPHGRVKRVRQTVRRGPFANELLHTAGFPLTVNRRVAVSYRAGGEFAAATLPNTAYTAESWLPDNTPATLRAAGTDYPAYIRQTYLQLPDTLPERVRNLALNLTATQPTPYDKAVAIEAYLRRFPYSLDVPMPPPGADVADFFLFQLKKGYCDYYATAMVVLARAAGLPARFVIGYAPGVYDAPRAEYRITEAEAHSWAQVYFPGAGWVDFEPTAGRAPIERSDAHAADFRDSFPEEEDPLAQSAAAPPGAGRGWRVHPFWWAALLAFAGYAIRGVQQWRLRRLPPRALSRELYGRMLRLAERAGFSPSPGATPYEFARAFTRYLQARRAHPLPAEGIAALAEAFVRQQYAPPSAAPPAAGQSLWRLWRALHPPLWRVAARLWLARRLGRLANRLAPRRAS